jgi:uncharacterized membrane protein
MQNTSPSHIEKGMIKNTTFIALIMLFAIILTVVLTVLLDPASYLDVWLTDAGYWTMAQLITLSWYVCMFIIFVMMLYMIPVDKVSYDGRSKYIIRRRIELITNDLERHVYWLRPSLTFERGCGYQVWGKILLYPPAEHVWHSDMGLRYDIDDHQIHYAMLEHELQDCKDRLERYRIEIQDVLEINRQLKGPTLAQDHHRAEPGHDHGG